MDKAALDRETGLKLAGAELAEGRLEAAAQIYAEIADRYQSVQALLKLARIRSQQGNSREAVGLLERARQLAPNSEAVLSAQAQVGLAVRAPVTAILALEPLSRMFPSVVEHHYLLGVALMQAGDMPSGALALEEALKLEPNRPLTLIALGIALNHQKLYAQARPHLLRSLELEPDGIEALAALAEAEEGLGEFEAAEIHAQRVLARSQDHAIANLVMGLLRMEQQSYGEARAYLEKAIATDPLSAKALYQLSLACARLGDEAGQQTYLQRYRDVYKKLEDQMRALRSAAGAGRGGM